MLTAECRCVIGPNLVLEGKEVKANVHLDHHQNPDQPPPIKKVQASGVTGCLREGTLRASFVSN